MVGGAILTAGKRMGSNSACHVAPGRPISPDRCSGSGEARNGRWRPTLGQQKGRVMSSPVVPKSASPEQLVAALIRLCQREFLASHEIAGVLAASLLVANLPRARSGAANPRGQEAPETADQPQLAPDFGNPK